jgi:hypothetical protein
MKFHVIIISLCYRKTCRKSSKFQIRNYFDSKNNGVKFCLLALLPTVGAREVNTETVAGVLRLFSRKSEVLHKVDHLVHPLFCFYSPTDRPLKQAPYSERS